MPPDVRSFGACDGHDILEITLRARSGMEARILTYGAVVRDLLVPAPHGLQRVVLGLNSLEEYRAHSPHFGAIAGRYANRIAGGRFPLDGREYQLPCNQEGRHSLHGGPTGFGKRPWSLVAADTTSCTLSIVSADGDAGYPGTLTTTCRYRLRGDSTLRIELSAVTDQPTVLNLCHHSYFNLDGSADILDHELSIDADRITPVDADMIPDGTFAPVAGTPFDFRTARPIRRIGPDGQRTRYDHNFMLTRQCLAVDESGLNLARAAVLSGPRTGIRLEAWTTEPCLQLYDGFKVDIPVPGLGGARYGANAGICLEPQHAPDSPNQPAFPDTVLRPGEHYWQVTEYRFS